MRVKDVLHNCGELAFAIECIHAASLILDDTPWMDNATTRRGRQTLHLSFSNKKTLMICHDVMYMVYLIWSENKPEHTSTSDWEHFIFYRPAASSQQPEPAQASSQQPAASSQQPEQTPGQQPAASGQQPAASGFRGLQRGFRR